MSAPSTIVNQGDQMAGDSKFSSDTTKMEGNIEMFDKDHPSEDHEKLELSLPEGCGLPVAEGGGVLSPLSGAYLLIVLSEPMSDQHKSKMIQKLRQGKTPKYIKRPYELHKKKLRS